MGDEIEAEGYATDIITDKSLAWMKSRDQGKPFFLMCHHKAPHREWEPNPKYRDLFTDEIAIPDTFNDVYKNRAKAAAAAKMRIKDERYLSSGSWRVSPTETLYGRATTDAHNPIRIA